MTEPNEAVASGHQRAPQLDDYETQPRARGVRDRDSCQETEKAFVKLPQHQGFTPVYSTDFQAVLLLSRILVVVKIMTNYLELKQDLARIERAKSEQIQLAPALN